MTETRSILVTGGFGFVGGHLVDLLLREGAHVHVVDDLSTSTLDVQAFARRAAGYPGTLSYDAVSLGTYLEDRRSPIGGPYPDEIDEIYHLASVVGPVGVLRHAGQIVGRVVEDTYGVMDLARASGARLCDVSTSEVYGGGRGGACAEDAPRTFSATVTVRLEYAVAKLAGEVALTNAARVSDLSAVIVRPFNVAGPGQSETGGFVLPRFVRQALAGRPLTVYGDGSAVRAFTHVADVADGIVRAVRTVQEDPRRVAAYDLGNPANRTTILDLARLVLRVTGSASTIAHVDPRDLHGPLFAEADDKFPVSDLATRELGWRPQRDLEQVVRDVAGDARSRLERPVRA